MSIDRATLNFLEKLNQDDAMQDDLEAALDASKTPLQTVVKFAGSKGFEVSAESLSAAKQALSAASELDEGTLDTVAGGFNPQPEPPARITPGSLANIRTDLWQRW